MQTKLIEYPCCLCDHSDYSVIYDADENKLKSIVLSSETYKCTSISTDFFYQLVKCNFCSLVQINPRPKNELLSKLAEEIVDNIYNDERQSRMHTFNRALFNLDKNLPAVENLRYLDLSCYYGIFVETLQKKGRDGVGIDICPKAVEKGNKRLGYNKLFAGDIENWFEILNFENFDVVTSWDAIEHIPDPIQYLITANSCLKKDGLLVLTTMDYNSFFARLMGKKWPWLMPMHLYYFTHRTIAFALEKAGFEVMKFTTYSHVVSLNYLLYKINSSIFSWIRDINFFKKIYLPINFGDFMTVYAKKKKEVISPPTHKK